MDETANVASAATGRTWGPEMLAGGGARFRLWAPGETAVRLRHAGRERAMEAAGAGWFALDVAEAAAGDEYMFVPGEGEAVPDPASRAQAGDVHGPSLLVDPAYPWRNAGWRGRPWEEAVISEIHIGTFTPEGTFLAAAEKLENLAKAGITAIEIMPVAQFAGNRGWGYDGVLHYAPHSAYGSPADFKALVDTAHDLGMMVLLDVVYNHFGPEGNYLHGYAPGFFRADRKTPWGAAVNFGQEAVRRCFIENALYWIGEFRLDGLRLDAIEQIHDEAERHVLSAICEAVKTAFPERRVHLVVEDQRNLTSLLERDDGGRVKAYTAEWNDDFHHVAHVIATGETAGHYGPLAEEPWRKLAFALQYGFVFPDRTDPPVMPTEEPPYLPPAAFIDFLQNHDQIGNRAFGERLVSLTHAGMAEALTAILLLSPHIPLLFMGEEYGETQPFHFFCDYGGELGRIVREGRVGEAELFGGMKDGKTTADLPDPNAASTFEGSKLRWERATSGDGERHRRAIAELVALRQRHVVPLLKRPGRVESRRAETVDGALALSWTFGGSTLELRANLTGAPLPVPPFEGAVIFEHCGAGEVRIGDGRLAPYSVVFAIDPELAR
jgi:malto-oligosyltrehalose trehalohydrolase